MSKYVEDTDNGYSVSTYYANGEKATEILKRADYYSESRYNESCKLTYQYSKSDTTEHLFENGLLVYYIMDGVKITDREQLDMIALAMGMYN